MSFLFTVSEMLEFRGISKTFYQPSVKSSAAHYAVKNLNLTIREGEFFSLLGPSGCGKTTLLRMIAGFEFPSEGEILLNGKRIEQMPAQERPFNMVFQKYALFPHLSVSENVAFGLKLKKMANDEIRERVESALQLVNMSSFRERMPETLSGGQSQRVAIARALVNRPQILLLDEPLSALDQKLREHMQVELKELQQKLGLTFIYVTHDQEEALALSDRVGVMNEGKLEQVSEPKDLYDEPGTLFTAQFVGPMTSLQGEYLGTQGNLATFKVGSRELKGRTRFENEKGQDQHQHTLALVRPEKLRLAHAENAAAHLNQLPGKVTQKVFRGTQTEIVVQIAIAGGQTALIKALVSDDELDDQLKVGSPVWVAFDPKDTFLFPGNKA